MLAFVAKWARRRPALDDEVMRLLEALKILCWIDTSMQTLDRRPTHEPGDDTTTRIAVQHSNLFGHSYRVVDGDDVPQDGNFGPFGALANHRGMEVDRGLHAPVGGVMLIGHDAIEPRLIG